MPNPSQLVMQQRCQSPFISASVSASQDFSPTASASYLLTLLCYLRFEQKNLHYLSCFCRLQILNKFPITGISPNNGHLFITSISVSDKTPVKINVCLFFTLIAPLSKILSFTVFIVPHPP